MGQKGEIEISEVVLTNISNALPGMLVMPTKNCGWVKSKLRFRDGCTSLGGGDSATVAEVLSHVVLSSYFFYFLVGVALSSLGERRVAIVSVG
jgi:hypothetical protein